MPVPAKKAKKAVSSKKKKKKASSGKEDEKAGIPLTPQEIKREFELELLTLSRELQKKEEVLNIARARDAVLQQRLAECESDVSTQRKDILAVASDMARYYKILQERFIHKINSLEANLSEKKEELQMNDMDLQELLKTKTSVLAAQDAEIAELEQKIDGIAEEFDQMLKWTVENVQRVVKENFRVCKASEISQQQLLEKLKNCNIHNTNLQEAITAAAAAAETEAKRESL